MFIFDQCAASVRLPHLQNVQVSPVLLLHASGSTLRPKLRVSTGWRVWVRPVKSSQKKRVVQSVSVGQRKMADNEVSSSTSLFSEGVHHYQAEPDAELLPPDQPKQDLFSMDDIVDLVGGGQDALERHMAEDTDQHTFLPDPEPPQEEQDQPSPVSSSSSRSGSQHSLVEPDRAEDDPQVGPDSDALPAAQAQQAAPSPAEEAQLPADTQASPAPASYVPPPSSKAQPQPLMQFPTVVDLLYWRDVKTTGVVFGAALLLLLSLTVCSIVSVCSYIGLALLSVTICFRIYKGILQAIQKSDEGHPFKQYLGQEVALSQDVVHKYSDLVLERLNKSICDLRRLFLVDDLVDSIKFALFMWILTYVGAFFNGLTLVILGVVAAFSCPIVYEKHQAQIDHYVALVNKQVKDVVEKIQAKVPGMKRKAE
ncbi:reticulon-4a isoform X7 [Entelurus aequoreus]|uniref:reticulon-4a isoform X7 n=1 Tax=Entelurus aequoreus TaxID=161455 RepID=UPI002B1E48CE|nr:reticulon-4a isoform X7 [Entelurus aequoreus]